MAELTKRIPHALGACLLAGTLAFTSCNSAATVVRNTSPGTVPGSTSSLPWPSQVGGSGPQLAVCHDTSDHVPGGTDSVDPPTDAPTSAAQLASKADQVVEVDAVEQRHFWRYQKGWPFDGWESFTATNLRVVRTLRGPQFAWVQAFQSGVARGTTDLPCMSWALLEANNPPLKIGSRYVLFLPTKKSLSTVPGGPDRPPYQFPYEDAWYRFIVVDGVVHTEAEDGKTTALPLKPQPLDEFLTSVGL